MTSQSATEAPRGVKLGEDFSSRAPVVLGDDARRQGLYIIGKTGSGKTTLLENLVIQDMQAGAGLCVLDPHGDLVDSLIAHVPTEREPDVVVLDVGDTAFPFGLNLFECHDLGDQNLVDRLILQAVELFQKLWGDLSWGPRVAIILRNCAATLVANQGYTLAEIPRLLLDDAFRAQLVSNIANSQVRQSWELEYNKWSHRDRDTRVESTLNKVEDFLTVQTIRNIMGFGRTTIDFRNAMDQGKILLVRLALGQVGSRTVSLIGATIVGQLLNAALSRQDTEPANRRQFNLYADEYHRFATPAFAELLAEARKYAVATTLAHQFRGQLTDEDNRGATLNAGNLIVFAVHGDDAEELAKQFDRTPPPPDVIGQRPKLSVSPDPVGHLLRSGHQNPRVRALVESLLRPLAQLRDTIPEPVDPGPHPLGPEFKTSDWMFPHAIHHDGLTYRVTRASVVEGLSAINNYLVELMEHRCEPWGMFEQPVGYVRDVIVPLRGVIGLAQESLGGWDWLYATSNRPLEQFITMAIRSVQRHPVLVGATRSDLIAHRLDMMQRFRAEAPKSAERLGWGDLQELAQKQVARLEQWGRALNDLGTFLYETPILVDSGQWEPIYDKPRSYSDVEASIASALVTLPKFHARVRILGAGASNEHVLRTPVFEGGETTGMVLAKVNRIRAKSREDYCQPREAVVREIERRHDESRNSPLRRMGPSPD